MKIICKAFLFVSKKEKGLPQKCTKTTKKNKEQIDIPIKLKSS